MPKRPEPGVGDEPRPAEPPPRESGIIRVQNEERASMPRATARDKRLSFAARGMLAYLLSHVPSWETRPADLINQSPAGRDAVRSILRELKRLRYMKREKIRDGDTGRFLWVTTVYERPYDEAEDSPQAAFPPTVTPPTGSPATGTPATARPAAGSPATETPAIKGVSSKGSTSGKDNLNKGVGSKGARTPPPARASALDVVDRLINEAEQEAQR